MDLGFIWTGDKRTSYLIRTSCLLGFWEEIMMSRSSKPFASVTVPKLLRDITVQIHSDRQNINQDMRRTFSPINL